MAFRSFDIALQESNPPKRSGVFHETKRLRIADKPFLLLLAKDHAALNFWSFCFKTKGLGAAAYEATSGKRSASGRLATIYSVEYIKKVVARRYD